MANVFRMERYCCSTTGIAIVQIQSSDSAGLYRNLWLRRATSPQLLGIHMGTMELLIFCTLCKMRKVQEIVTRLTPMFDGFRQIASSSARNGRLRTLSIGPKSA